MIQAPRRTGWLLLVTGVIGLVAAFTLTVEKIEMLQDKNFVPSCNISPILSCGSIMKTEQASVFGFPNPLLGIVGFTIVVVFAALVISGVGLPRWWWAGMTAGAALGMAFLGWLMFESLYRIGRLCPYCMVVWTITPIILITAFNQLVAESSSAVLRTVAQWRWTVLAVYYAIVILLGFLEFQDYWMSLV